MATFAARWLPRPSSTRVQIQSTSCGPARASVHWRASSKQEVGFYSARVAAGQKVRAATASRAK